MTFPESSDHFSLGSKWFWYLQNDKMCTLGPTESLNEVGKGPRKPKNVPQNPTGPIRAHFGLFWGGGRPEIFLSPFGPKKAKFCFSKKILICIILTRKGSGTLKNPKLTLYTPQWTPFWPILWAFGPIWGQKHVFIKKKLFLLKIIFYRFPDGRGPSKTENCPFIPPPPMVPK